MSEAITQAAAYDLIDRFLRNNLHDDDYAKYSNALEALSQPAMSVVSDEQIKAVMDVEEYDRHCCNTYWPLRFARAILALRPPTHQGG